ncbi:hypothetical protein PRIPAC_77871 [Pristionchus pacificus]|uniref:Uncharacterized protein n=1 Tax=Pristionchus pacificus TaxID=54126 RepID=A0A2A6CNK7_PRIPA|nr:hypothetical protein PRIPAC_77871 [Pristionchus pacificus]|eukprot:PDM79805.1 hypothetical protein PRIPAC_32384 [Pristionchus pacificus]
MTDNNEEFAVANEIEVRLAEGQEASLPGIQASLPDQWLKRKYAQLHRHRVQVQWVVAEFNYIVFKCNCNVIVFECNVYSSKKVVPTEDVENYVKISSEDTRFGDRGRVEGVPSLSILHA